MQSKILLINLRHIGDALLITPLIANLKNVYPDAQIDVLVNAECAPLFKNHPQICNILAYDRTALKELGFLARIATEVKFALKVIGYDLLIATTEGERSAFLAFLSAAKIRVGIRPPRGIFSNFIRSYTHTYTHDELIRHTVERNLDALRAINLPIVSKKVELFFSESDERIVNELAPNEEFIQIHAASRWSFKCLPHESVAKVIDALPLQAVLTGASSDADFNAKIIALCQKKPIDLSGKLTLTQTAALSSKAKLFFGVDSAPMHIAASQNTPCIAVFGPSGAFNWGPWDNELLECGYTRKNGFQNMGKHSVLQVDFDCAPCGKDGCNGSKKSDCLDKISAEDIIRLLPKPI